MLMRINHIYGASAGECKGVGKDTISVSNPHQCTNHFFFIKSAWLDMMSFFLLYVCTKSRWVSIC